MTTSTLQRLCQLVAPPAAPCHNQGDWDAAERELGTKLPEDYKRLIETFGQGGFLGEAYCSGLLIASYLGPAKPDQRARGFAAYFGTIKSLPYHLYPGKPGLLGFGSYGDRDTIAWNVTGPPAEWAIVYHDPESGFHEFQNLGTLDFILSMLEESSPLHKKGIIDMGELKGPHAFNPEM